MSAKPFLPEPLSTPTEPLIPMVSLREETRWEYHRLVRDLAAEQPPSDAEMNELGRAGWELTGIFSHGGSLHLIFKRPG